MATVQLFRAKIVDVAPDAVTVEATGDSEKIEALLRVLEPFGVKELVQSGHGGHRPRLPLDRGPAAAHVTPEDVRAHHEGNHAHSRQRLPGHPQPHPQKANERPPWLRCTTTTTRT